jgi:hypothetical protein
MNWNSSLYQSRAGLATAGIVAGLRARVLGLPYNTKLQAHNVREIPVDGALIEDSRHFYQQRIADHLDRPEGRLVSGPLALYVKRPGQWQNDITWWSADDPATHEYLEATFFQRIDLRAVAPLVALDRALRMYATFIVVRSRCRRPSYHKDYIWACGQQCYTLMTPLEDWSGSDEGHLSYLDVWGRQRVYRYRLGVAVVFGAGFLHSTQAMSTGPPRAFLCFTFGTDRDRYWPALQRSIYGQSRQFCRPGGQLVRDAMYDS